MRILLLEASKRPRAVEVLVLMGTTEFKQLGGDLTGLVVFASSRILEPATAIRTGARHRQAKYLLFPSRLRHQFKTEAYDFQKILCGTATYRDKWFVIYSVPRKGWVGQSQEDNDR